MISVGTRFIGEGSPCFLIAEIGINHNGDMELARRTIEAAAAAGVDAVKFQNYRTEDFIKDRALTYSYNNSGHSILEKQYDMFKRCELDLDRLSKIADICKKNNVIFFSTPTSLKGIADLLMLDVPILKNGSDYLSNLPLIKEMAKTGLPTMISTGMATLAEIDDSVRTFRGAGGKDLILLHCVSSYPTPMENVHLPKIKALENAFECTAGFSDHTKGHVAALGAVALGASVIEKHFTLDQGLPGPDHWFSSNPTELQHLVRAVRDLEVALKAAPIGPAEKEGNATNFRLSCVAAKDLPRGHVLCEGDIAFARPGHGIPPKHIERLVGGRLSKEISCGHVLKAVDFK